MSAIADRRSFISSIGDSVSLLTVFPLSKRELDRERAGRAMLFAPLVGLGLGVIAAIFVVVMRAGLDPRGGFHITEFLGHGGFSNRPDDVNPLAAIVGISVLAVLTRGLHLDGLADTVDALASYKDKAGALAIMRKPDLGPIGMAAVVLALMAQVASLEHCINLHRGTVSLAVSLMASRLAMTLSCTPRTPAARTEGLGALVAGTVPSPKAMLVALLTGAAAVLAALADIHSLGRVDEMVRAAIAVTVSCSVAHLLRAHCVRRIGGITGDVLGFLGETTFTLSLVVMAFGA